MSWERELGISSIEFFFQASVRKLTEKVDWVAWITSYLSYYWTSYQANLPDTLQLKSYIICYCLFHNSNGLTAVHLFLFSGQP